MTIIRYKTNEIKKEFVLEAKGHAGSGATGNDIVCAAVSALTQTLMITGADEESQVGDGYIYLHGQGSDNFKAFKVIATGLKTIANQYPEYVKMKKFK